MTIHPHLRHTPSEWLNLIEDNKFMRPPKGDIHPSHYLFTGDRYVVDFPTLRIRITTRDMLTETEYIDHD